MNRTRIKICGLTRSADVSSAIEQGADAIGFIFYDKSPRSVSIEQAAQLLAIVPPYVSVVGLFVNPSIDWVQRVIDALPISVLQFHGEEEASFCEQFALPYYKALRVITDSSADATTRGGTLLSTLPDTVAHYASAKAVLLDAYDSSAHGGTGHTIDWVPLADSCKTLSKPVILAGGLTADNVARAISIVRPYAVDVSSGVEESPGQKSPARIDRFIKEVMRTDAAL